MQLDATALLGSSPQDGAFSEKKDNSYPYVQVSWSLLLLAVAAPVAVAVLVVLLLLPAVAGLLDPLQQHAVLLVLGLSPPGLVLLPPSPVPSLLVVAVLVEHVVHVWIGPPVVGLALPVVLLVLLVASFLLGPPPVRLCLAAPPPPQISVSTSAPPPLPVDGGLDPGPAGPVGTLAVVVMVVAVPLLDVVLLNLPAPLPSSARPVVLLAAAHMIPKLAPPGRASPLGLLLPLVPLLLPVLPLFVVGLLLLVNVLVSLSSPSGLSPVLAMIFGLMFRLPSCVVPPLLLLITSRFVPEYRID